MIIPGNEMNHKRCNSFTMKRIFILQMILALAYMGMAQQVVSSAGAAHSGAISSISYSVGEIAVSSGNSSKTLIHEGVIQDFLQVTINVEQLEYMQLQVFPNPVQSYLEVQSSQDMEYEYTLVDMQGKIIEKQFFTKQYTVPFIIYTPGAYMLYVLEVQSNKSNSYTIIKK